MRPSALSLGLAGALALACGDDGGRGTATAATAVNPTTVGTSFGTTTDAGSTTTATGEPTDGSAGVTSTTGTTDPSTSSSTTGPDETTGPATTGPDTTTTTTSTTTTTGPMTTGEPPECVTVLKATIRDFKFEHPDFEDFGGDTAYKGIVQQMLGPDKKPVYAHPGPTPQTTGPNEYAQWYNNTPGVNIAFEIELPLTEVMPGKYTYQNNAFFPIDDQGFGNEGQGHNFSFTTEIHTEFTYSGGEVFTFTGDDDLWLFINGKLAIDLGGLHPSLQDSINLDANAGFLGIQLGGTYSMDIFHAERHTGESNFRIDTSIQCFIIPG
jgi:fibro-slime domain-containing protein